MVGGGEGDGACSGVVGGGVGDGTIGLLALAIRLPRYSGMEVAGADAAEHPLTKWPFSVLSLQLLYKMC